MRIMAATLLFVISSCSALMGSDAPARIPFTTAAPNIDGELNDAAWAQAAMFMEFRTMKPDFGKSPSEKTIVYITFDHEFLYVAFHSFDRDPSRIKATIARRDNVPNDDWVGFCLDASNDQLTAYAFISNPLGIQMDGMLNAGAEFDPQWDGVWSSAGKIVEDGYTVEMAILFKSIRFPNRREITMGFKVARNISRKSEEVDFPEFNPARGAALAQFQKIAFSGVRGERIREILPAFTWGRKYNLSQGRLQVASSQGDFGVTSKYGITSDLTLDATYNPDFSQVESDAGQIDVNLRYSLYYPIRRVCPAGIRCGSDRLPVETF